MRRAILFLIFALFLAWVIQPNLNNQIKEKSDIRVPVQTKNDVITNNTIHTKQSKSHAVICIDAAHGGTDNGYSQDGLTSEKDVDLAIAQKIGEKLQAVGYKIVYTRSDDSTLSNDERISSATSQNAQYLISIQANSSNDTLSKGYSIFTQPNDKMIQLAKSIADSMNTINLSQFEGIDSDHYENFPILYNNQIPSILLEVGYLSNSDDYTKLTDESVQNKIAESVTKAFIAKID